MLVFLKASDGPCSKTFYARVALKILFLNEPARRVEETESSMPRVRYSTGAVF